MSHKLLRLTQSLQNQPMLIEENTFKEYMNYLDSRNLEDFKTQDSNSEVSKQQTRYTYNPDTQAGVIELFGPTTYRPTMWQALCGGYSYQALKEDFESLINEGAKTIAMIVSSPGGEAHGMTSSAQYIRKILDENNVELIAMVDGMSASAGYGLTSIADKIIATKDSELGSIGVVIQIFNDSKALEQEGYDRKFITAGSSKVPFEDDGTWREGFLQDLQDKVNTCYEDFTSHVANMRNIDISRVKSTEARMFFAEEAIALGLCDAVMTPEEFYDYFAVAAQNNMEKPPVNINRMFKLSKKEDITEMAKLEEMQAALTEKEALLSSNQEAISALTASVEQLQSQLQASSEALTKATAAVAEMEKAKAEAAVASRKAQLSEVLAADQVEANFTALAGLDDASFGVVLGQFKAVKEARAASFAALGSDAAVELEEQKESQPDGAEAIRLAGVARAKALAGKR